MTNQLLTLNGLLESNNPVLRNFGLRQLGGLRKVLRDCVICDTPELMEARVVVEDLYRSVPLEEHRHAHDKEQSHHFFRPLNQPQVVAVIPQVKELSPEDAKVILSDFVAASRKENLLAFSFAEVADFATSEFQDLLEGVAENQWKQKLSAQLQRLKEAGTLVLNNNRTTWFILN